MHSLVRSSKRMLERRQPSSYCGLAAVSFGEKILKRPNAPSPANFRLFAPPYLGYFSAFVHTTTALSVSRRIQPWRLVTPNFPRDFRPTVLKTRPRFFGLRLRGYHILRQVISDHFDFPSERLGQLITPHLPCGIRFGLCRFHSPLLTVSRLISFPAPTKMFQSGAFPVSQDQSED